MPLPPDFKPTLCRKGIMTPADLAKIKFPVLCSFKLDGIRGTTTQTSKVQTRSGKAIPNRFISKSLVHLPSGLDHELIVGDPTHPNCYNITQSAVMSEDGEPDFRAYVFDVVPHCFSGMHMFTGFESRLNELHSLLRYLADPRLVFVQHTICYTPGDVEAFMAFAVDSGYEGICGRSLSGFYKFGRSGLKDEILWRIKQESESECEILEVHPLQINNNDTQFTPLGYKTRSSHAENQIPIDSVGSFTVRDIHTRKVFEVGIFKGITSDVRDQWWVQREDLLGMVFKYRFHDYGIKDLPRSARFIGWRSAIDMGGE